ncbi:MAG TPA: SRPBCC family protein [Polyangiaceae bacterium]
MVPDTIANVVGARPNGRTRSTLRALGIREIACGLGILAAPRTSGWLWMRVAGDAMDLGLLGNILFAPRSARPRVTRSLASTLGITALDVAAALAARRHAKKAAREENAIDVQRAITVNRPKDDVYRFWRDLANLPSFMAHLESVRVEGSHSHWRAKGPAGTSIEWDAEIEADRPGEIIAWRSRPGASVPNRGSVKFLAAPGGRGTEVCVELRYDPPAGKVGAALAKLFGEEPSQQIAGDLRRFKQVMETGEVLHSDASIHRGPHPARPSQKSNGKRGAR